MVVAQGTCPDLCCLPRATHTTVFPRHPQLGLQQALALSWLVGVLTLKENALLLYLWAVQLPQALSEAGSGDRFYIKLSPWQGC